MSDSRAALEVMFPAERDLAAWERSNSAGEVPGRWPYGLEQLQGPRASATTLTLRRPSRLDRIKSILRSDERTLDSPHRDRVVGVTWDENMAYRMAVLRPHREMFSGVIWLTDALTGPRASEFRTIRSVLQRMSGLWVLSRAQIDPLESFLGRDAPRIEFVRFGVDEKFFTFEPYPESPMVFSAGGDRDRDTATLFEALAVVHTAMPSAEIIVQSRSSLAPPEGVTKISHVSHVELRKLYRRASVIAVATRSNLHVSGLTVSLESMATGRPIVITDTPGIRDYVEDGTSGRLVSVGDSAGLAAAVVDLLRNPDVARHMGNEGLRAIQSSLTTAHLARRISRAIRID